ncbi:MAG: hypothetical protein AAGC63_01380 [Propionicimonas sp.]|nr:hypothetical protein [Propionicimonas sp.]
MGSLLHPVGPEEPRVYWVRRALVIGAAALVAVGLVWLLWPQPGVVTANPPATGTSSSATSSPPPSTSVPPTPTPSQPAGPQPCDPSAMRLTVAGFQRVKVSTKQTFTLSVINGGKEACILTISPETYTLTVNSGKDRIWSTADCTKWLPAKKLTVQPETAHEFQVEWPLRRSEAKCKVEKAKLQAGTYVATAVLAKEATAKQVMQLVK